MTKEEIEKELELEDHNFKFKLIERLNSSTLFVLSIVLGLGLLCFVGILGMLSVKFLMWFYGVLF